MRIRGLLGVSALLLFGLMSSAQAAKYYGGELCGYKEFKCVKVKKGDTWLKLFPDERERKWVKRLNRMNQPVRKRPWIVVPTDFSDLSYMNLAPFKHQLDKKNARKKIVISLSDQAFAAYNKSGKLIHWGPMSGGKAFCSDTSEYCRTVTGNYQITRKQGEKCKSSKFPIKTNGGAPMPYCMHFFKGYALHAANLPGKHASHGCVRLLMADAKWLNTKFATIGTPVIVRE